MSGVSPLLVLAALVFAVVSVVLAVIDLRSHRLPDAIVLPALVLMVAVLTTEAVRLGEPGRALGVVGGTLAAFAVCLALHLFRPAAFGGGDVKLAALIGAPLGWSGLEAVASGIFFAFLLAAVAGAGVLLAGARRAELALGPWLLAGAWARLLSG